MAENAFGYNRALPEGIRDIFMWLCQDVASLHDKWGLYLGLFGNEEDTDLLSELAQGAFQVIEESLRADMAMSICRLSDPAQSSGKDNLSLRILAQQCAHIDGVCDLEAEFLAACEPVRAYRNKRIGHNDLNTTIRPHDNPLPGIGRSDIERILETAAQLLNLVYQDHVDSELAFFPLRTRGADALLYWLKEAKQYEVEKMQALTRDGSAG